jgi:hypothetical protein
MSRNQILVGFLKVLVKKKMKISLHDEGDRKSIFSSFFCGRDKKEHTLNFIAILIMISQFLGAF